MVCESQVRCSIDELDEIVHPQNGHPRILAMLFAYLDESGIHEGAPICVVAGYFGGKGQWKEFEKQWRRALDRFKVPLEEFHTKDLMKCKGFFEGWPATKRDTFLDAVAGVIGAQRKIHPVSEALQVEDFWSFSDPERRFMTGATLRTGKLATSGCPSKPYFVIFQGCVRRVAGYAPVGGKAHYFLGLGKNFSRYAESLFNKIKNQAPLKPGERERLGSITFPEARETPQLQAADLLAHLTYLHCQKRLTSNNWNVPPERHLNMALTNMFTKEDHLFYTKDSLRARIKQVPEAAWGDLRFENEED